MAHLNRAVVDGRNRLLFANYVKGLPRNKLDDVALRFTVKMH